MNTFSYTHTRNNLAKILDEAEDSRAPIVVTRSGKSPSVILSMEEYESMEETLHVLSSAKNAARIHQSLADYEAGNFVAGQLVDAE